MAVLNYILVGVLGYIVLFGLKDREDPTVSINFPKNDYEFRTNRKISVSADDNKRVKSIIYLRIISRVLQKPGIQFCIASSASVRPMFNYPPTWLFITSCPMRVVI